MSSVEPIIVNAKGGGFVIYMRPAYSIAKWQMEQSYGERWDPIERAVVKGGVPVPMERLPFHYETREAVEASIRTAA